RTVHAQLAARGVLGGVVLTAGSSDLLGEPRQVFGGTCHLAGRLRQPLPGLEGEGQSDLVSPVLQQVHGVVQDLRAGTRRRTRPVTLSLGGAVCGTASQLRCLAPVDAGDAADALPGGGVGDVREVADVEAYAADPAIGGAVG